MKLNILLVLAVTLGALAASFFLVPREKEQALMLLQSGDVEASRRILEGRLAGGDLTVAVVTPLTRILLDEGDIDGALRLIARFLERNPDDAPAMERFAELLRQANRMSDYAAMLRRLYAANDGKIETLQDYAGLALFLDQRENRLWALQEMVNRRVAEPEDVLELAQRRAARGDLAQAAQLLEALIMALPGADDLILANHLRIALALQDDAAIRRVGTHWLATTPNGGDIEGYLADFDRVGRRDLALDLIAAVADQPERSVMAVAFASIEAGFGRPDRALARLEKAWRSGPLPGEATRDLFDLALNAKRLDLARDVWLQNLGADVAVAMDLLESAEAENRKDIVAAIRERAGPALFEARPLLAARLALADGKKDETLRWLEKAAARTDLAFTDRILLGQMLLSAGDTERGSAELARLAADPRIGDDALADLGEAYFRLKRFADGAALLGRLRESRKSSLLDAAWARLAAAAGDFAAVQRWLATAELRDPPLLEDLHFIAADRQAWPLAIVAAERLQAVRPVAASAMLLARALLNGGRPREAITVIDRAPQSSAELREIRFQAQLASGDVANLGEAVAMRLAEPDLDPRQRDDLLGILLDPRVRLPRNTATIRDQVVRDLGDAALEKAAFDLRVDLLERLEPAAALPYRRRAAERDANEATDAYIDLLVRLKRRDELTAILPRAIERAAGRKQAEQRLYILLEQPKALETALPFLRRAAAEWRDDWPSAYEDALVKLGRRDELLALVRAAATDTAQPAPRRREAAFRLLELGERSGAEAAFRALAEREGPRGENVNQLLYLWGPRPARAGLDWLEQRAKQSQGEEQTAWLRLLQERGGGSRALALLTADPAAVFGDPARLRVVIDLLIADRQADAATDWLQRAGQTAGRDVDRLLALLDIAEVEGLAKATGPLSRQLLEAAPDRREAQRLRAAAAFAIGRKTEASRLYAQYLGSGPGDWESHFHYGELLLGQQRRADAREHFTIALAIIERQRRPSAAAERARAFLLGRLGRPEDAITAIDRLLATDPSNTDLRTDLASLALELGRADRAEQILAR